MLKDRRKGQKVKWRRLAEHLPLERRAPVPPVEGLRSRSRIKVKANGQISNGALCLIERVLVAPPYRHVMN